VADRRQLHARVAQALASLRPEQMAALAHHWAGAEAWDKAAAYHRRAGERAAEVHASAEAVEHYSQALALLDRLPGAGDPARRYELLLAREAIHDQQGQREAQADDLEALEGLLQVWKAAAGSEPQGEREEPSLPALARQRAEVAFRRARYTGGLADYAAAVSLFREAVRLARAAEAVALEVESRYQWARTLALQGQWEEARQQFHDVLEMARQGHLQDLEARILGTLTQFSVERGNYDDTRLWGQQALHLFREHDDRRGEGLVHNGLGLAAAFQGDYGTAQSHFAQALDLAHETGNIIGQGHALFDLGLVAAEQGDPIQARAYYEQALRIFTQVGDQDHENRILNNLGVTLCQLGAYPEAQAHFERFLSNCHDIGSRYGQVVALVNLAYVSYCLGRNGDALEQGRQALHDAEELGERRAQGYVWTIIGDALADLDRLEEAEAAYRQALALRQELGQPNLAMESLAGLVRLALTEGDHRLASTYAGEIVEHLRTGSLAGTKDPFRVYLSCYQALHAAHDAHAERFLADAYHRLQAQAARIADDQVRRSFLDGVAAHREILAAYAAWQDRNQRQVRLPRAEAPTGRPLRDDEYVTVTWTLVSPEDEAFAEGPARRQAQIRRLLREAAEQGADPGVGDLAAALAVSEPTIRRDLAALRRAGHAVRTRGSRGR
jgi:tetratricopeptide (TPR) repeat protein